MEKYFQPEIECADPEEIKKLQSEKLVKQVWHVWNNVPYYRAKMEAKGVAPDDIHGIEDLYKLPFLSKADLKEAYPYGLMGCKKEDVTAQIKDGYLTISATTNTEKEEKDEEGKYLRRERYSGSMSRRFFVGENLTEEDIQASFEDGILKLNVPKEEPKKVEEPKQISGKQEKYETIVALYAK